MKDINIQNPAETNAVNKTAVKDSFLKKKGQKHYWIASGAILAIIVFHFVFQFSFIQNENFQAARNLLEVNLIEKKGQRIEKTADNIIVPEIFETDFEEITSENETMPEENETLPEAKNVTKKRKSEVKRKARTVSPPIQNRQKNAISRPRKVIKKNLPQPETRAERLRRAEKILTGV